jgi:hypothetical protein
MTAMNDSWLRHTAATAEAESEPPSTRPETPSSFGHGAAFPHFLEPDPAQENPESAGRADVTESLAEPVRRDASPAGLAGGAAHAVCDCRAAVPAPADAGPRQPPPVLPRGQRRRAVAEP